MYGYNIRGKIISVLSIIMMIGLAFYIKTILFRILFALAAVLLIKDAISVFTMTYQVDQEGLFLKDYFGRKQLCNWYDLEYITITKRNRDWIAVVSGNDIKYIKKHIDNKSELLKEIISYAKKNKNLGIHDIINKRYQLGLKLNDEGKLRSDG